MTTPHPQAGAQPTPGINPAVLMAQQVAARLAAGGPPPGSAPPPASSLYYDEPYQQHQYHPSQQQQPHLPAMNPMVAAALANVPGVRMAGQAQVLLLCMWCLYVP